jgi:hypothetical protein
MTREELLKRPLSVEYVDGIIDKFILTCDKYRSVIPEFDKMVQEIETGPLPDDKFAFVLKIVENLAKYKTASPFMNELFENIKMDFLHGSNEDLPRHEGKFYIDSVVE